jgi:hypothetical protein
MAVFGIYTIVKVALIAASLNRTKDIGFLSSPGIKSEMQKTLQHLKRLGGRYLQYGIVRPIRSSN